MTLIVTSITKFRVGDAFVQGNIVKSAVTATTSLFRLESRRYTRVITAGKKELIQYSGERCWEHRIHECDSGVIYGCVSRIDCVSLVTSSSRLSISPSHACIYICQNEGKGHSVIFRERERVSPLYGGTVYGLPKNRDLRSEHARIFLALSTLVR